MRWRAGTALVALVAAIALPWSAAAQTAAAELQLPDLTVTTEDPLILLPPLGPPVSRGPRAVPRGGAPRVLFPGAPLITEPGIGAAPQPIRVLRSVQARASDERATSIHVSAGLVDPAAPGQLPAALRLAIGDAERSASVHLSGRVPLAREPGEVAVRGLVDSPAWQLGLDGSLATAGRDHAWHAAVNGASGPVQLAFSYHRWHADPAAPGWQAAAGAALVWDLPAAPEVRLGIVAGWSGLGPFAFPAMRLHYVPAPRWRVAAGVRPLVGYPRRVADLVAGDRYHGAALHPDRALLVWLGGGHGAVDLRIGLAHGLHGGTAAASRAVRQSGSQALLFGVTADLAPGAAGTGPVAMTLRAGGNWYWRHASWSPRLLAAAEWRPAATLPVALLARARWIQSTEYTAIDTDEEWSLGIFREAPGMAIVAGLRWTPAYGHDFAIVGGVQRPPPATGDLTWGFGFEYAHDIVRLLAAPDRR